MKKWERRQVVVVRNYLATYPLGKDGVAFGTAPASYIRLDKAHVQKVTKRVDTSGIWPKSENPENCFGVTNEADQTHGIYCKAKGPSEYKLFFDAITARISASRENAKKIHEHGKPLDLVTKQVKKPLALAVAKAGIESKEWTETLIQYHAILDEWRPVLNLHKEFVELYHEKTMDYIDWFTGVGATNTLVEEMISTEERQLTTWRDTFSNNDAIRDTVVKATEECFFREDFFPTVEIFAGYADSIDLYNKYRREVLQRTDGDTYEEQKERLGALTRFLGAFPPSSAIDLKEGYETGSIRVKSRVYEFQSQGPNRDDGAELRAQVVEDMHVLPMFSVSGFEMLTADYGTVLWNNISWVWFHPQLPFTLRFNYKRDSNVFAYHKPRSALKPGQYAVLPSFKWNGSNGLQPIVGQGAELDPAIAPNFATATCIEGAAPLPVLLTVALTKHICFVTQNAFGYGNPNGVF